MAGRATPTLVVAAACTPPETSAVSPASLLRSRESTSASRGVLMEAGDATVVSTRASTALASPR